MIGGTFTSAGLPDLPLFLVPHLSLLLRFSRSLSCSLCFSVISLSLSPGGHSHRILRGHSTKEDGQQFDSCWGCHMSVLTCFYKLKKNILSQNTDVTHLSIEFKHKKNENDEKKQQHPFCIHRKEDFLQQLRVTFPKLSLRFESTHTPSCPCWLKT